MAAKAFEPIFGTPLEEHCKEEVNKRNSDGMRGTLHEEYRSFEDGDISWEAEQLSKSYGIYLEYNRAKKGREKDWIYMIRLCIPGGGPIPPEQWSVIDDLACRYGRNPAGEPSIRLTTRATVQFHWVPKDGVVPLIKEAAEAGLLSINGCGDNVRNILSCAHSTLNDVFDPRALAVEAARYFTLPTEPYVQIFGINPEAVEDEERETFKYGPQLLNRKFKMAFSTVYRDEDTGRLVPDNCVELRTHDLGVAPVVEGDAITGLQIYVGGGQGERNGKPTASMLAEPLGIVSREQLMPALDAVVGAHQEWGDRKNRHWARLKYLIKKQGVAWFREKVEERLGWALQDPKQDLDIGERHLHHGWFRQSNGNYAYGAFIECGRLMDNMPGGDLRTMVNNLAGKYRSPIILTPNQDLIFSEIPEGRRQEFEQDLRAYGHGLRNGRPVSPMRMASGACVGKDTCRLAYTDSEQFEPELMDSLEDLGWGDTFTTVGITGCERQCFRPGTKTFGLIGTGNNRYMFKLFGTEDGRHQGIPLSIGNEQFLRSVPRESVATVIDTLLRLWSAEGSETETPGYFLRRFGAEAIVNHLKVHPKTADLMVKPAKYHALV